MTELAPRRVAPFGHLGINACVPLPRAYRSLPRPSSPPCAQASSTCLRSLDSIICSSKARAIITSEQFLYKRIASLRCVDPCSQSLPTRRLSPGTGGNREHMFHDHVDHQLSNSGDDASTMSRRRVVQEKKRKLNRAWDGFEAGDT